MLQYLLGLRRLGHDVHFVEPIAAVKLQPRGTSLAHSANAAYFREVVRDFDLEGRAALLVAGTREIEGGSYEGLRAVAHELSKRTA